MMKPLFKYIFLMFLIPLFAACGGGGGSAGVPGGSLNPKAFSVNAPNTLTLAVGQSVSYQVSGGKSPYLSVTNAPSVSTAVVDGSTLTVGGFSVGEASITVTPTGGGASKVIALTVIPNTRPLQLQAPGTIDMLPGNVASYVVFGGTPPYRVVSSNANVVIATAVSGEIRLQALDAGDASIQVFDSSGDAEPITRSVTVVSSASLFTTESSTLTMAPNVVRNSTIGGGVAPYTVSSSDTGVIKATVTGTALTITSVADGFGFVDITDARGRKIFISVTVSSGTVVSLFTTESSTLTMAPNVVRNSTIGGGVAPYTVSSSDTGVVKATVTGTALTLTSVADGFGFVDITDARGRKIFISVTVSSGTVANLFTTAPATVTMAPSVTRPFTIGGGVAPYTATSSNTGAATVAVTGTALNITSVADGSASVVVTDARGTRVTVAVTVTSGTPADLFTTAPSALTMSPSATRTFTIGGGVAPYSVQSSNSGAVTATVPTGTSSLNVTAVADGSASLVVTDARGTRVTIAVTVTGSTPADLFTTAPSALTMSPNDKQEFTIGGGVAPYQAISSNLQVVSKPDVSGTVLTLTTPAGATGTATVFVTDSKGNSVSLSVTVSSAAQPLSLSPDAITIPVNLPEGARIRIIGGAAPFTVTSGIPAALGAVVVPVPVGGVTTYEVAITPKLVSDVDVTVVDSAGQSAKVKITTNAGTAGIRLAPSALTISDRFANKSIELGVSGAIGDFRVFTSDIRRTTVAANQTAKTVTVKTEDAVSLDVPTADGVALITITVVDSVNNVATAVLTVRDNP